MDSQKGQKCQFTNVTFSAQNTLHERVKWTKPEGQALQVSAQNLTKMSHFTNVTFSAHKMHHIKGSNLTTKGQMDETRRSSLTSDCAEPEGQALQVTAQNPKVKPYK